MKTRLNDTSINMQLFSQKLHILCTNMYTYKKLFPFHIISHYFIIFINRIYIIINNNYNVEILKKERTYIQKYIEEEKCYIYVHPTATNTSHNNRKWQSIDQLEINQNHMTSKTKLEWK